MKRTTRHVGEDATCWRKGPPNALANEATQRVGDHEIGHSTSEKAGSDGRKLVL